MVIKQKFEKTSTVLLYVKESNVTISRNVTRAYQ